MPASPGKPLPGLDPRLEVSGWTPENLRGLMKWHWGILNVSALALGPCQGKPPQSTPPPKTLTPSHFAQVLYIHTRHQARFTTTLAIQGLHFPSYLPRQSRDEGACWSSVPEFGVII